MAACRQIKTALETTTSDWDREKLQERLGKLAGSVAVIKVGAATEVELKEKKHRVEDALCGDACRRRRGHRLRRRHRAHQRAARARQGEARAATRRPAPRSSSRALEEPLRRIAINAGKDGSVIVQQVKTMKVGEGYDAAKDEFGNMINKGIIDPLKVTRAALENAISIAGMVLTTNCLVTEIPTKQAGAPAPSMSDMY